GPTGVELSVESDKCLKEFPEVFTACAVTRALARAQVEGSSGVPVTLAKGFIPVLPAPLSVDGVIEAQKEDATLEGCFAMIVDDQGVEHDCFVQDGLPLGGVPCIQAPDMRESGGGNKVEELECSRCNEGIARSRVLAAGVIGSVLWPKPLSLDAD
ncbi:unnamed protein product, partial [Boreogadus saida]